MTMSHTSPSTAVADTESGARGAIYGLLARLFEEPDRELFEALRTGEVGDQLASWIESAGLAGSVEVPDLATEDDYDLLCARFNDIFEVGYPEPPVPLYESAYHDEGRWERINVDLARAYDYFGVSIDDAEREHHDHLVVELEFVGYLARLAAMEDRDDVRTARRDFLSRHLVDFVGTLEDAMAEEVETGIYDDQVRFLAEFVRADHRDLDDALDEGTSEDGTAAPISAKPESEDSEAEEPGSEGNEPHANEEVPPP